ncbi:hypothetical protein JCM10908_001143 [Rhodotorula pacifica]|uniref:putative pantetheine-phosphate adenylyltransferase n=1 Tax=Rhodotorula pacifica TaxID=1495444 RepID=UPI00317C6DB6
MSAYCVLTYPTLAALLSSEIDSTSASEAIRKAAQSTTQALTIIVRTTQAEPDPWTGAALPALAPASSSSSSSSSSSAAPPPSGPTALFLPLEQQLARLYSLATDSFIQRELVLARVDVVVEQLRRQTVCLPAAMTAGEVVRWDAEAEADGQGAGNGDSKGKGRASEVSRSPDSAPRTGSEPPAAKEDDEKPIYPVVALGGTFDHLHSGHKILLTMAASITSRKLIVGVTDDALLGSKKYRHLLEPLSVRIQHVQNFIALVRPEIECDCVPLQDVYGPTANDPEIEALVVSDETRSGGEAISSLRASKGLSTLRVYCISLVADSTLSPSSTSTADHPSLSPSPSRTGSHLAEEGIRAGGRKTTDEAKAVVVVSPATKMGSTGIREWLARKLEKQEKEGERQEPEVGVEVR